MNLRLKSGFGYWQTDRFPIGGDFHRAGPDGKVIAKVHREFPNFHGVNTEVIFIDGTRGAIDLADTEAYLANEEGIRK